MKNDRVSIIIPSRNERFLPQTVADLLAKCRGDFEIIVVMDGYWHEPALPIHSKVKIVHKGEVVGMRDCINSGVAISTGRFILKLDAHCLVDEAFDLKMVAISQERMVQVPRRYRLDPENWCIRAEMPDPIDYHCLSRPDEPNKWGGPGLHGKNWHEKTMQLFNDPDKEIDDIMTFQGSCWFMERDYYDFLELMDSENYGSFVAEAQEIGFKAWLSGGRVVVNKRTWYAHLHKGATYGRGYKLEDGMRQKGIQFAKKWTTDSAWKKQVLPFSWFIEKFSPIPGWD